uniref:Uncharacterized protein n=1 Tax=Romanomermis culicivorax TaxID=13658 RepID=A0A915J1Z0_ROMCU
MKCGWTAHVWDYPLKICIESCKTPWLTTDILDHIKLPDVPDSMMSRLREVLNGVCEVYLQLAMTLALIARIDQNCQHSVDL